MCVNFELQCKLRKKMRCFLEHKFYKTAGREKSHLCLNRRTIKDDDLGQILALAL